MALKQTETIEEVEREYPELKEVETKVNWDTVPDSFRKISRTAFLKDAVTDALQEGKTVRIWGSRGDRYYRWAHANDLTLNRRTFDEFTIMWITKDGNNPTPTH